MADRDVNRFLRAADERLKDARALAAAGRYGGSVYLAGYVIECGLKAVHLSHVPAEQRTEVVAGYRSAKAHEDQHLLHLCDLRGAVVPDAVLRLVRGSTWTTDLRYDAKDVAARDADAAVDAAAEVVAWTRRST